MGGHSVQPDAGIPEITGGVLSIFIVTDAEFGRPAPFVAEQVSVIPEVSAVSVVPEQPFEDAMPDSGSAADQITETLLRYQPFGPIVPDIVGVITGGVVSDVSRMKQ